MRRTGNTTRIIDRCIQELFKNGFTYVYDGRDDKEKTKAAFDKFLARMTMEHYHVDFEVDKGMHSGIYCYKITQIK